MSTCKLIWENKPPRWYTKCTSEDLFKIKENRRNRITSDDEICNYWEPILDLHNMNRNKTCFACALNFKKKVQRAHITAAGLGGLDRKWNLVYLCPDCHKLFDSLFMGYPSEYYQQIEWIYNRFSDVLKLMFHRINKKYTEEDTEKIYKNFKAKMAPSNLGSHKFYKFINNKNAKKYIQKNVKYHTNLEYRIQEAFYIFDKILKYEHLKTNKNEFIQKTQANRL